jgi:hypothetical protein
MTANVPSDILLVYLSKLGSFPEFAINHTDIPKTHASVINSGVAGKKRPSDILRKGASLLDK